MPPERMSSMDSPELDHDSDEEETVGSSKGKGKKGAAKESEQRKQQNRIAQREFRQRKQAYVKDLEARVALHESSKDEQLDKMTEAIKTLLDENHQLRALLSNLGGFIGSGIGGCLPQVGLTIADFESLLARGRLDTLHELMETREKDNLEEMRSRAFNLPSSATAASGSKGPPTNGNAEAGPSTSRSNSDPTHSRGTTVSSSSAGKKRSRTTESSNDGVRAAPVPPTARPTSLSGPPTGTQASPSSGDPPRTTTTTTAARARPTAPPPGRGYQVGIDPYAGYPPATSNDGTPVGGAGGSGQSSPALRQPIDDLENGQDLMSEIATFFSPAEMRAESKRQTQQANDKLRAYMLPDGGQRESFDSHEKSAQVLAEMASKILQQPTDNPKLQAIQLIAYHMRNKQENPSYHLPPSLRATTTQQNVPHSPWFDGIIFASMRDRLILLKDQFDLPTLWNDLMLHLECHENSDSLLPANWELSESFIRKYWFVIDQEVLGICNRWRKERGDPTLEMKDIVPDGRGGGVD